MIPKPAAIKKKKNNENVIIFCHVIRIPHFSSYAQQNNPKFEKHKLKGFHMPDGGEQVDLINRYILVFKLNMKP